MKIKKIFLLSGFVIALTASFAFTSSKKRDDRFAYYYSGVNNPVCTSGYTDNAGIETCSPGNTGPSCTIYDFVSDQERQAYQIQTNGSTCYLPLYLPPF